MQNYLDAVIYEELFTEVARVPRSYTKHITIYTPKIFVSISRSISLLAHKY